ncbi:TIGR03032 family protein [Dongia sp. agr-C8]
MLAIVPPAAVRPEPAVSPEVSRDLVEASPRLRHWLRLRKSCLALSTGESGKILTLGAGASGLTVFDVSCELPGALLLTEKGLHVAAHRRLWRFDDALSDGECFHGNDRLCLPSQCRPTGAIGIQDLAVAESGKLLAAVSGFNCVARINSRGDLKPVWRPAFIDKIVREDRCHLSGFCLRDGAVAYVTVTAASNLNDGWQQAQNGGQVIDAVTHRAVAEGLGQPTAPRLYRNRLWVLESGTGWLGWIDAERRSFERFVQLPGTPRGLRFVGDHALVVTSGEGAGIHWVNLRNRKIDHRLALRGSIAHAIDVALIPGEAVPRLAGLSFADSGLDEPQQIAG